MHEALTSDDALIIVDVQKDFLPGGKLAVADGDQIIPVINRCIDTFVRAGQPIVASRDWHPPGHCSFQAQGGSWPQHCVQHTEGAEFSATLQLPAQTWVVSKGDGQQDAYSAFQGTTLNQQLRDAGVRRLFVAGLATDYCVLNTVLDALKAGFAVWVLTDAVRAVNVKPGDGAEALRVMARAGARMIQLEAITDDAQ